ncbi:MAG: DUF47 family protein [Candidatus Cloacimonetes bacterium]|nr:DUF47 family protein [Candidatus Cloacimonadota bacterium]
MKKILVNRSKDLQTDIDSYLDRVEEGSLIFFEGVKCYLRNKMERFDRLYSDISLLETDADHLRRDIKRKLYTFMLIPEARGDVLGLLENLDNVIDIAEKVLEQFSIETPEIPDFLLDDFEELADLSSKAVNELVKASRAFFKENKIVSNYINKIHFYEHQADGVEESIKRKTFSSDKITRFSNRVHLRYFTEKIASVSDEAESVGERLSVYAIKRGL